MTGLLVSVRSGWEARQAVEGGADLVDVKEPARGALGSAEPTVWGQVAAEVAGRVPTSVALGELHEAECAADSTPLAAFQFAKLGLAGCRNRPDWLQRWARRLQALPAHVTPVAVVYADWVAAESPRPEEILERAVELRCGVALFDTCDKTRGDLLDHLGQTELTRLSRRARHGGLRLVLGGGLVPATIRKVLTLEPDYIAVRGAVCRGDRAGDLDAGLVRRLQILVRGVRATET